MQGKANMQFEKTIQDDIYILISNALAKMPDRAAISRQIYERYNVNSFMELSDAESMEVLSYCDGIQYKRIKNQRDSKAYNENLLLLNKKIETFVDDNSKVYQILSDGPGFYLVVKKINPTVHINIVASVFQPIEKNVEREYFILFLVQTEEEWKPDGAIEGLMAMGIKQLKVLKWDKVESKFESVE